MFLGVVPVVLIVYAAAAVAITHSMAVDFRGELYPEARMVLHWQNPFPPPDADLSNGINRIYPIPAALLAVPFTLLPLNAAAVAYSVFLIVCLAFTLYLLGIRDWRIYGVTALWPSTLAAIQTGNLTIVLALLVALAWRYRTRTVAGVPVGLAIALKLYLWPVLLWLVAVRKPVAAAVAAAVTACGVLMTLPFMSLHDYSTLMANLGRTFAPQSATLQGLLLQLGADADVAKLAAYATGGAILVVAYRRRSLGLFVAAGLALSPIVWLHYFLLFVIPLGITRQRFTPLWLAPLLLWLYPGNGVDVRAWHVVLALTTAAIVFVGCERRPRPAGERRPARKLAWTVGRQPLAGRAE
jgi:hypothetical protein